MFDTFIKEFPVARDLMKGGAFVSPLKGAPLRCGFRGAPPIMGARVIAAGEALGTTFPFTGEGIGKAMETGSIAAAVVEEALKREEFGILSTYGERLEKDIRPRYLGYEVAEDWLSHGWLNDLIASRASRSPFLTHALEGVINESEDPREVFSLAGILRSFWS
jgi:flavin-dependent dehydrogenase